MIRDRLNSLIEKKYFTVAFSIITSIVLWMYVTYVDNPEQTNSVSGIDIEYIGEDLLEEHNLVVTDTDRNSLTIRFSGRRNAITKLNRNNVKATVDLKQIINSGTGTGVYQLSYDINYPNDVNTTFMSVVDASADYITVTVEELVTAEIPVEVVFNGSVADGYQARTPEVTPKTITISGTDKLIANVAKAMIVVDQKNLEGSYRASEQITLVDKNGIAVDDTKIDKEIEEVQVDIEVVMIKSVDLEVDFAYTNAITAANFANHVEVTIDPPSVTLAGDVDVIEKIDSLKVGTIDLSDFAESTQESFTIPIPNDMTNITGVTSATVTVEVKGFESVEYAITNVSLENETEGYETKIETKSLNLKLRGSEADMAKIKSSNIRVVADLEELGETTGTYSVPARIYLDGYKYVDPIGDYFVTVTITKK